MKRRQLACATVVVGGVVVAAASRLDWVGGDTGWPTELTGMQLGEGKLTLALGVALVLVGLALLSGRRSEWLASLAMTLAGMALAVVILVFATLEQRLAIGESWRQVAPHLALYAVAVGALSAGIGAWKARRNASDISVANLHLRSECGRAICTRDG